MDLCRASLSWGPCYQPPLCCKSWLQWIHIFAWKKSLWYLKWFQTESGQGQRKCWPVTACLFSSAFFCFFLNKESCMQINQKKKLICKVFCRSFKKCTCLVVSLLHTAFQNTILEKNVQFALLLSSYTVNPKMYFIIRYNIAGPCWENLLNGLL